MIRQLVRILLVLVFVAFSAPLQAADPAPVSVPGWVIDPASSQLAFVAIQQGAEIKGTFSRFSGDIHFDPARPQESHATIRVDMASVDSQSAERDQSLQGPDWFGSESFPESIYRVAKFEKINENQYIAKGELVIRDLKQALDLPLTIHFSTDESGRQVAKAEGEVSVNRLDYGVGQGAWQDTQAVGNPVKIRILVIAHPAPAAPQ
ncbi:MAG: YceI family protein [Alphaproteobacteria bacterium]|nr:YceI family protein [Alphaproteobacteria bacterium]